MTELKNKSNEWIMCGLVMVIIGILPVIFLNIWLLSRDLGWGLIAIVPIMNGILMLMGVLLIFIGVWSKG